MYICHSKKAIGMDLRSSSSDGSILSRGESLIALARMDQSVTIYKFGIDLRCFLTDNDQYLTWASLKAYQCTTG